MYETNKIVERAELMSLLDQDRNLLENIDVSKLSVNSNKRVNWKCEKGHTFQEKISVVYKRKHKCYFCTGRQIWSGENDLLTLYPDIAKEFDIEKNGITPDKISPRDTDIFWWTCEKKHPSFPQSVEHRVSRNTVCPYCSGRKAVDGENDLQTLFPEIAKEWDVEGNDGILPNEVPAFTYNSYTWICPKGHSYHKKVALRTKHHKAIDCPYCIKAHTTSFPEQAIYYYAKKCFPDAINRYKDPFDNGMELDIYIPKYKMGIEYDGVAFHNDEQQHNREYRKYSICKNLGIKLVRIKESEDTWNDTADKIFYVYKKMKDSEFSLVLRSIFENLFFFSMHTFDCEDRNEAYLNRHYGFPIDFNVTRDRPEILEYLVDVDHSFGTLHPELAVMWSDEDNKNATPFMFTSGSNYPAIWKCPKCGRKWTSPICSIVSRKVKTCKKCSMKESGLLQAKKKIQKNGSLAERCDALLKQWDFEENGNLSPYEISLNYNSKVAWKCEKCGYKWRSSPSSRVRKTQVSACPHCTGRVAMPGVDDLETLYPDVAKSWDFSRNGTVLPSQIRPFSNIKYYWICPTCGKSYLTLPGNRIKGRGCLECGHSLAGKRNAKTIGQYDESGKLVNTFQGLHEAARQMQVVPNAIFQAVKSGKKSKGFFWHYIEE